MIAACKSTAKQSVKETSIEPTQITGEISAAKIRNLDLVVQRLARLVVDEAEIDGARIRDASITDAKIVELTASKIAAGIIDASIVTIKNLVADNITTGTLNGQVIPQLGTDKLQDGAVTGDKVATNAIGADKIVAGAITAEKIAADSINATHITSQAITTDKLAADVGENLDISANQTITFTYNNAKAYADSKASDAESNAKSYTDAQTTAITDDLDDYKGKVQSYQASTDDTINNLHTKADATQSSLDNYKTEFKNYQTTTDGAINNVSAKNVATQKELNSVREKVNTTATDLSILKNIIGGYQQFSEDGLEIGKIDSGGNVPFKAVFAADKLSFYEDNNEVAYIGNKKMFITQAQVTDGLMIGNDAAGGGYSFVTTETGMALRWR